MNCCKRQRKKTDHKPHGIPSRCAVSANSPTLPPHNTRVPILVGAFDLNDVAVCLEVMAGNGCLGLIRVPLDSDTRKAFARRCLDAGAIGVYVSVWGENRGRVLERGAKEKSGMTHMAQTKTALLAPCCSRSLPSAP